MNLVSGAVIAGENGYHYLVNQGTINVSNGTSNVDFRVERLPKLIGLCESTAIVIPNSGLQEK